jgi:hypothetical protein
MGLVGNDEELLEPVDNDMMDSGEAQGLLAAGNIKVDCGVMQSCSHTRRFAVLAGLVLRLAMGWIGNVAMVHPPGDSNSNIRNTKWLHDIKCIGYLGSTLHDVVQHTMSFPIAAHDQGVFRAPPLEHSMMMFRICTRHRVLH